MNLQQQQQTKDELTPGQRLKVEIRLSVYRDAMIDLTLLEEFVATEKAALAKILADADVKSFDSEDYLGYWTRGGTTKRLNPKKLLSQGVTLAQIEAATDEKPKRDSFTIRAKKSEPSPVDEE